MRSRIVLLIAGLALVALQPGILRAEHPAQPPDDGTLPSPWVSDADSPTFDVQSAADDEGETEPGYVPNRLLVRFEPGTTEERKRELHAQLGGQVVDEIPALGVEILQLYDDSLAMVSAYQANP
ncbi:MAG: S8 family serine peptidase, partial [Anaerolineae bacterium]